MAARKGTVQTAWAMGGDRWRWLTRDFVMFVAGLAGFIHELVGPVERPSILAACVGLMGYPAVRGFERSLRNGNGSSPNQSGRDPAKK